MTQEEKTKRYDYGIISGDTIKLFNNSLIEYRLLHDDGLEDVNVEFCDNGVLKIDAKKIEYDFYSPSGGRRIFEEDWERTPHLKEIKEGKRHFWSKNKERYVNCGWVRTAETTPVQYIINKYKVEIYD